MYRPLPEILTIKKSSIEGLGLYAQKNIKANTFLGITHILDERFDNKYIRTPLGGFYNHSNNPNVQRMITNILPNLKCGDQAPNPDDKSEKYKIPQIGWNVLLPSNNKKGEELWKDSILKGFTDKPYMYFLHSYFVVPENKNVYVAKTHYGQDNFCSVFQKDHIYGCQFHPERSGEQGLMILKNFLDLG